MSKHGNFPMLKIEDEARHVKIASRSPLVPTFQVLGLGSRRPQASGEIMNDLAAPEEYPLASVVKCSRALGLREPVVFRDRTSWGSRDSCLNPTIFRSPEPVKECRMYPEVPTSRAS
ncbi:hypothetical protein QCA50_005342 [Cerrena zonata]|uniref:Uncharacterized protein n=1 Tax=Cerrena zonata TaxID=2478898 RepID=A0AAW0GJ95_9APHY